jgi:hypothetical protein
VIPALITGYYYCDNCDRTVESVQHTRGYWLCDECWALIMPDWEQLEITPSSGQKRDPAWYADTAAQRARIAAYWEWLDDMQSRKPRRRRQSRAALYRSYAGFPSVLSSDDYYPLCACGQPRRPLSFMPRGASPGLFGGPFAQHCPVCEAKLGVEAIFAMVGIHPDWDDEQWLDALQHTQPEAFALGVLPNYWFRLRYPEMYRTI